MAEENHSRLGKIEQELVRMNTLLVHFTQSVGNSVVELKSSIDEHETILIGDGKGTRGMSNRLTALEDLEEKRRWSMRVIWAAIAAGAIEWLRAHFPFK